jgi:hypothetical protein
LNLQVVEAFEAPPALICTTGDGGKAVFSPLSPSDIRQLKRDRRSRLSQYADRHPLLSLPRSVTAQEISVLNNNLIFDLELPLAWKGLTGQGVEQMDRTWMYVIS